VFASRIYGFFVLCRLIYKDFVSGGGGSPADGQQVVFDYTGYNESGTIVDSSYRKGRAAEVRLGINGLIPGRGGYAGDDGIGSITRSVGRA
jgi:hypothetical protein